MSTPATAPFTANGRAYRPPARPVVVICIDGSADEYLDAALARGRMPNLQMIAARGYRGMARGALPSFTNTNNASIFTGAPPAVHGISGNFFLDPETGREVMMNSAKYLRAGTIPAAAAQAGRKVAIVTAKDKLRDIFSHGLKGISFSSEKAREANRAVHGIDKVEELAGEPMPPIYSAAASLYVLKAGAALLEKGLADFLYLSTTDYIQHKHEPENPAALDFYAGIDAELGRILARGAIAGITADHGMNAKQTLEGKPKVIYLESYLADEIGDGAKVILPITDPYVLHHGALGSFVMVYLADPKLAPALQEKIAALDGITEVLDRRTAARKLELPPDRIGDLIVLSGRDVVIGKRPEHHDLSAIASGLRSHGGRYEEMVPFIISEPLSDDYLKRARGDVRNFDIFDFTINGGRG